MCKIVFCTTFPDILEKSQRRQKTNRKVIAKRYALKGNHKASSKRKKSSLSVSRVMSVGIEKRFY